jgi:RNA polymerase sigma-54 factor
MQLYQSFVQKQQLKMNPQLYQSIKLMELPIVELHERIEQELESNPALEVIEDKSTISLNETDNQRKEEYEYFETTSDPGRSEYAAEEHRRFIEGVLTRPETLQEHLLWQLQLEPVDDELRSIAGTLIQNLDDDGFHKENPETLFPSPQNRLQEAMKLVQGLEPAGTCTSDYRQSLIVQIGLSEDLLPEKINIQKIEKVLDNLELLEREKYSVLAKKTGLSENDVRNAGEFLKKMSPFPGRAFAPADVRYVIPDIRVTRDGDDFNIILNDEVFPVLGISPFYREPGKLAEKEARDFARKQAKDAQLFIRHLKQRNQTLVRVTNAILKFQKAFFINGPKFLTPLTLTDIAGELEVHETTVSRTANGKYIQTEWGIYEIRYFFTNSVSGTGEDGAKFSKESVKETIKEIVTAENRLLSDQEISALLGQKGIALARRTVAKYRKELDMGSSYTRKVHKKLEV